MGRELILIIDDEADLIELLVYNLEQAGFDAIGERDGRSGLERARQRQPAVTILDLMLPGIDGLDLCQQLRRDPRTSAMAIIMLTAKTSETDRVVGLELGADDYVVKPFSPRELVARVKALLRRKNGYEAEEPVIQHGRLRIDLDRYEVTFDGRGVPLTVAEFQILKLLARRPHKVLSRDEIIHGALGRDVVVTDRTIDVHIGAVRRKLGDGRHLIETIRGVGYRFSPLDSN
jgi:two-component system phosphate regulon response regulator PhoB